MDEYVAVRRLRFPVRVGMDLLNKITNFVANVIERVRQAVYFLVCRLAHEFEPEGSGGGGGGGEGLMVLWGL